jgi:hypothetical protein
MSKIGIIQISMEVEKGNPTLENNILVHSWEQKVKA